MAEQMQVVELRNDFYQDGFKKLIMIILSIIVPVVLMVLMILYLYFTKPAPITFVVGKDWRVLPPVPVDQPYRTTADMLQWVSDVLPNSFVFDFVNYNDQLKRNMVHFTSNGWKSFLNQLNTYANYNNVQANKIFISVEPASAPFIVNQGLTLGRYGWYVQMPVKITSRSFDRSSAQTVTFKLLVVRVPTDNNLAGIGIDDVSVISEARASLSEGGILG